MISLPEYADLLNIDPITLIADEPNVTCICTSLL